MSRRLPDSPAPFARASRRTFLAVALTTVGAIVVSCSGGSAAPTPTNSAAAPAAPQSTATTVPQATPTPAGPTIVKMTDDYKFTPAAITIAKGTTVEWQGVGTQPHTVTADPAKAMDKKHVVLPSGAEPFDSGIINAGASWKHTFTVPGDYSYICVPHEAMGMLGKVTVT